MGTDDSGLTWTSTVVASRRFHSFGLNEELSAEKMNNAISLLSQYEKDYYARGCANPNIPKLVLDEDRFLLTDYMFYLMKQLRLCRFTEDDRKTRGRRRQKLKIGYGGLQCIH